jgi:4-hydroxy-3-methylbut-2-enyl diphosphate reductase
LIIRRADHSGFCHGVSRAVSMAREAAAQAQNKIYTLGPLIHNARVVASLKEEGIFPVSLDELSEGDTVVIRSHGTGPQTYVRLDQMGCRRIDATCPYVQRAQRLSAELAGQGYQILILGDPNHPEVMAYREWIGAKCLVIQNAQALEGARLGGNLAVMAQTTENQERFSQVVQAVRALGHEPVVLTTICSATEDRVNAARRLAPWVDAFIVVGDRHSSNTSKLRTFCQNQGKKAWIIENAEEIATDWFHGIQSVGVTAGASTPEWIIKEVIDKMEEIKDQTIEAGNNQETENNNQETENNNQETENNNQETENNNQETENNNQETENNNQETENNFSEMEAEISCRAFHPGDMVKGVVVKVSADEILVDFGFKSEGIIPVSELAFTRVDPLTFVQIGEEIQCEVLKEDREGNLVLSRKNAIFEERLNRLEEAFEKGELVEAPVIEVVKGGLLVDVGIRGFVPASQISRSFVKNLDDYLHQTLRMKIIELNKTGRKVVLSQRAVLEEEIKLQKDVFWNNVREGEIRKGIVRRLTDFGAFIDVGGVDGLLHVSEMGWSKVNRPSDLVSVNDEIDVLVLRVDRDRERVSLGLRQLISNPWDLVREKYPIGGIFKGKVKRLAPFGAFIELEPGVEGLAHISQLANFRVERVEDVIAAGQIVDVKVIEVNLDRQRVSLSVRDAAVQKEAEQVREALDQQPETEPVTVADAAPLTWELQVEDEPAARSETAAADEVEINIGIDIDARADVQPEESRPIWVLETETVTEPQTEDAAEIDIKMDIEIETEDTMESQAEAADTD